MEGSGSDQVKCLKSCCDERNILHGFTADGMGAVYGDLVYVSKSEAGKVIRYWQSGDYSMWLVQRE